jgi:hypothetical protein
MLHLLTRDRKLRKSEVVPLARGKGSARAELVARLGDLRSRCGQKSQ